MRKFVDRLITNAYIEVPQRVMVGYHILGFDNLQKQAISLNNLMDLSVQFNLFVVNMLPLNVLQLL